MRADTADTPPFAELCARSNFTFLEGASHPDELVHQAKALGYRALAIADTNTLAGIVRAHVAAQEAGLQLIIGSRIVLQDPAITLTLYPTTKAAYGRLCRLLTLGKRRADKGACTLTLDDVAAHHEGLLAVLTPPQRWPGPDNNTFEHHARRVRDIFDDDRLSLALSFGFGESDHARAAALSNLADRTDIPLLATNDALYHIPERSMLHDVVSCIRLGCTLPELGLRRTPNFERHLKPPAELHRLFADHPAALARTIALAQRAAGFSLDQIRYEYPDEVVPAGKTPMSHLRDLVEAGAKDRYPSALPDKVRAQIDHELALIDELRYAPYFLTVHDLVAFARSRGILCQGRGAAANSAVCYCLGVTSVDPARIDVLFERFVSRERNEPPDIDIDFEHERREEVIQYIYAKYGRERAALTAEVVSYRGRSAIREVGKAFGLSLDCVDRMAKSLGWWEAGGIDEARVRALGLNPRDTTIRWVLTLAAQLLGFPRHLSQHVGGFVITRSPLCELVPIENAAMEGRTIIEWDKDDIDALDMMKVDVLGLGMLTCIRKALDLLRDSKGIDHDLATIPAEDLAVYDMICKADTVGVFQIESRAQMSMLPRLKPRCFYDLVIEVSIVRPGPIQGNMVHPYLRRRNGEEPIAYPSPELERVLSKTLGVPLFQEQAMQLSIVAGGFTPGEAEKLRRTIASWKTKGRQLAAFGEKLIEGMIAKGYDPAFAQRVFEQIKGFSSYGFPESHAASFALLVYASCWLKCHHPDVFACALLNSQPMGFYQPAQIVRDAAEHGVTVLPVDAARSQWDCTLEPSAGNLRALRLGMRLVKGLRQDEADKLARAAGHAAFRSVEDAAKRSGIRAHTARRLAEADAFPSLGLDRQAALWAAHLVRDEQLPLFPQAAPATHTPALPPIPAHGQVTRDYAATGLSLKAHPISFARPQLDRLRVTPAAALKDPARTPPGRYITLCGVVLIRQRPGTASGIVFITLEDETGTANLIVRPRVFDRYRAAARHATVLLAHGRIERVGDVVHLVTTRLEDATTHVPDLQAHSRDFH